MFWLAATVGAQIFQGVQAKKSADKHAGLIEDQGLIEQRSYERQAIVALDEGYRLRQQQAVDFINAGVALIGTPLLVLAETAKQTEISARELRTTGKSVRDVSRASAKIGRSEGKAALISSVFSGVSTFAEGLKVE